MRLRLATVLTVCASACSSAGSDTSGKQVAPTLAADAATDSSAADVAADVATGPKGPPRARIFAHDPVTDDGNTAELELVAPTSPEGKLTGPWVDVSNCLQEDGGLPLRRRGFTMGALCHEVQTVKPDADGNYLSVKPPGDFADGNDPFAELQMYYHVSKIHDFFHDGFGLIDLDFPLSAIVNLTMNIDPDVAKYTGQQPGWNGFQNALFMPAEGFAQFGLPARDNGAIVFGQFEKIDFSYDASVIYHEYTHAMVGTTRLAGATFDAFGMDNLPGAMNEGFADYFSCSLRDDPHIGPYALSHLSDISAVRDLSIAKKCPDDLTTEVHADGKIIGSALWDIRTLLGATQADGIILKALQSFTAKTSLKGAGQLILAEANGISKKSGAAVKAILDKHGVLGCQRAKELVDFDAETSAERVPYAVFGTPEPLPQGMPGYLQFYVQVPAGSAVEIGWHVQNQGPGKGKLDVAVKNGSAVQLGLMDGKIQGAALLTVESEAQDWQHVVLANKCVPADGGPVYLMFLNPGKYSVAMDRMTVKLLPDAKGKNVPKPCL